MCRKIIKDSQFNAWYKITKEERKEIVTSLDIQIEDFLIKGIKDKYPSANFISEEINSDNEDIDNSLLFIIDPIDGTKELVKGSKNFSISVAVLEKKQAILGILDFPAKDQRFHALNGKGAFINNLPITVSTNRDIISFRMLVSPNQIMSQDFEDVRQILGINKFFPVGAFSPKISLVSMGEYDGAFYLGGINNNLMIWDYAASIIILKEAGGKINTLDGNDLLNSLPYITKEGWLATNGLIQESLLEKFKLFIHNKNKQFTN